MEVMLNKKKREKTAHTSEQSMFAEYKIHVLYDNRTTGAISSVRVKRSESVGSSTKQHGPRASCA